MIFNEFLIDNFEEMKSIIKDIYILIKQQIFQNTKLKLLLFLVFVSFSICGNMRIKMNNSTNTSILKNSTIAKNRTNLKYSTNSSAALKSGDGKNSINPAQSSDSIAINKSYGKSTTFTIDSSQPSESTSTQSSSSNTPTSSGSTSTTSTTNGSSGSTTTTTTSTTATGSRKWTAEDLANYSRNFLIDTNHYINTSSVEYKNTKEYCDELYDKYNIETYIYFIEGISDSYIDQSSPTKSKNLAKFTSDLANIMFLDDKESERNSTFIIFTIEDKQSWILTGENASKVLTNNTVTYLLQNIGSYLQSGSYTLALENLVFNIKNQMNASSKSPTALSAPVSFQPLPSSQSSLSSLSTVSTPTAAQSSGALYGTAAAVVTQSSGVSWNTPAPKNNNSDPTSGAQVSVSAQPSQLTAAVPAALPLDDSTTPKTAINGTAGPSDGSTKPKHHSERSGSSSMMTILLFLIFLLLLAMFIFLICYFCCAKEKISLDNEEVVAAQLEKIQSVGSKVKNNPNFLADNCIICLEEITTKEKENLKNMKKDLSTSKADGVNATDKLAIQGKEEEQKLLNKDEIILQKDPNFYLGGNL